MNTFQGARAKWLEIFGNPDISLEALKARAISPNDNLGSDGIRSVCWKVYLSILPTLDLSSWPALLAKGREEYSELHRKYIRAIGSEDSTPNLEVNNPLSLAEDSPWQQFFVDSELRKVIRQDVERTFPDNDYFRSEKVQNQLTDILFIYCKIHHDVSYRQGMHELLAHMLWVVSFESLDVSEPAALTAPSDPIMDAMKCVLDSNFIEHDTFILFSRLMVAAKPWYEFSDEGLSTKKQRSLNIEPTLFGRSDAAEPPGKQTPVIEWSMRIFQYLRRIDSELYNHLTNLEIQPQLFGIRWFRLLFGREFPMDDVFVLWDGIFSVDPSLKITTYIGLTMLLHIRDELLESDFSMCLHKLMRYPPCKDVRIFIRQGIYLQSHPTAQGGVELIRQNYMMSGKPLPPLPQPQASDSVRLSRDEDRPYSSHQHHHHQQQHSQNKDHNHERSHGRVLSGSGGLVQHLPPSALEAIKPVAEGFAHVTKNVLESKGGAALNRAIHDMKKNTQSYIRKAGNSSSHDAQPIFPPMFDQVISSSSRLAAQSRPALTSQHPSKVPSSQVQSPTRQPPNSLNAQLGQVVAKAITILEAELSQLTDQKAEGINNDHPRGIDSKGPSKASLAALSGLEHVRDVLLGQSAEWNPLVIESTMLDQTELQKAPESDSHGGSSLVSASPASSPSVLRPSDTATKSVRGSAIPASPSSPALKASRTNESSVDAAKKSKDHNRHHIIGSVDHPKHMVPPVSSQPAAATGDAATFSPPSISTPTLTQAPSTVKNARPFSFDDLVVEVNAGPLGSDLPQRPASKGSQRHDDLLSKSKSPRSSLASSQFSWMLENNGSLDSARRGSSGGYLTSHRSASTTDIQQESGSCINTQLLPARASIDGVRGRMKLDPLAGAVTKSSPTGAGGVAAVTVTSAESLGPHAERTGHDPLQELST